MRVWTVANQKGGVGKTTTAVALGGLAAEQGARVLLVDMDPHGSLTSYFGHSSDAMEASTFTLFDQQKQLSDMLVSQIVMSTYFDRLYILPSATALATLERKAIGDGMGLVIGRALAFLKGDFDLVIIDCPPQLGVLMINALAACEQLILPVQTEFLAIKGLERMLRTLQMLGKSRHKPLPYTIVPTMFDRRTQASVTSLRTIRQEFGDTVWPSKIPIDTQFRDASRAGKPPHLYDKNGRGISAYRSLYKVLASGGA